MNYYLMSLPNQELPVIAGSKEERPIITSKPSNDLFLNYAYAKQREALNNWRSSLTIYPIKEGMETAFREFAEKYYSINIYPNSENIKQGIKLPDERVGFEKIYIEPPPHIHSNRGDFMEVAILLPERVEETHDAIWMELINDKEWFNMKNTTRDTLNYFKSKFNLTRK